MEIVDSNDLFGEVCLMWGYDDGLILLKDGTDDGSLAE